MSLSNQPETTRFGNIRAFVQRRSLAQPIQPSSTIRTGKPPRGVRHKIIAGYVLALGVATLGSIAGLTIGNYYQQQATQIRAIASREQRLLSSLQVAILQRRPAKELSPYVTNPDQFRQQSQLLLERLAQSSALLDEIQALEQTGTLASFQATFQTYQAQVDRLYQQLETVIEQIQPLTRRPNQATVAQQLILNLVNSPTFTQFIDIANQLTQKIEAAQQQEAEAEAKLQQVEALRTQMILISILVSIIVAAVLAVCTSRAIARPIEALTTVAQQVTQAADFKLRADVITHDEVGTLATSLNQLIQWVDGYTQELRHAQTQLIQTEKMSSLGQMVAGIAHEINNPVNFIYGNLNHTNEYAQELITLLRLYQQHYPDPVPAIQAQIDPEELEFLLDDLPKTIVSMQFGADRIRQIVLSLRNFSRLDEAEKKAVDIHEGLDNTLLLLNHRLKRGIAVTKEYGDLPLVECHPAQLNQVFMNILSNAIDALHTEPEPVAKRIVIQTTCLNSEQIQISLWNNGADIPQSVIAKLFDPFFTTKPVGQGTGLGLAIAYQIIEKHQGAIAVFSSPGEGVKFQVTLPISGS